MLTQIARPYAAALFDLAKSEGSLAAVETGLAEARVKLRRIDTEIGALIAEAIDKVGRLLGLPYPAGPDLDRLARNGDPQRFDLPRGLAEEDSLDFSFSGVKTAAMNRLNQLRQAGEEVPRADFAASLQEAVVDVLVEKSLRAAVAKGVKTLFLSGGVAANSRLRERMTREAASLGIRVYAPSLQLCTDNAAMIASAGYYRLQRGERSPFSLNADPSLRLGS